MVVEVAQREPPRELATERMWRPSVVGPLRAEPLERVSRVPVYGFPRALAMTRSGDAAFLTIRWLNGALAVDLLGRGPKDRIATHLARDP